MMTDWRATAWSAVRRVAFGAVPMTAAFASGSTLEPAAAEAHCGHDCGTEWVYIRNWCDGSTLWAVYHEYNHDCSGTCYNGGTAGCCDSPEACAGAPCKPGGCGGLCAWTGGAYEDPIGGC